jgi:hypothetical protein
MWMSSGLGLLAGAVAGLLLARGRLARSAWAAWGVAGPWVILGVVMAAVRAFSR